MPPSASTRTEYIARINRVLDYIDVHLDEALPLEALARVACFSPFHFHRIFGAMVGEAPTPYVKRVRLEKAASLLLKNPEQSITDIALRCGFSSSASFARAFRASPRTAASGWTPPCPYHPAPRRAARWA